jgi:hypothetical protein
MSDRSAMNPYLDCESEIQCECGCLFKVSIIKQDGHNDREEYYCPDCRKEYFAMASLSPTVVKLNNEN